MSALAKTLGRPQAFVLLGLLLGGLIYADWHSAAPPEALAEATYVGRESCAACHQAEHDDWTGSHHDLAMGLATEDSVLGDFNNQTLEHFGVETRFYRDGERFMVRTEGPDGELADFEVKYTFGVEPLQQYMVELPAGDGAAGRIQVLRESWDTVRGLWFYVTPPDVTDERILPGDPLHWTGVTQNWNTSCGVCHSTNFQKNYDLASHSYHTTYAEIDVSCEECHGPASLHIELANATSLFWDRRHGYGLAKLKSLDSSIQIEACAKCHMRHNGPIHPEFRPGRPLLDLSEPALLAEQLYHADGQILDEVYVYGSFLQSKMHAKGVRCTDCHNPHSLQPKFEGNALCAQCHEPAKYDVVAHHRHPDPSPGVASAGSKCIECHMPATTYMVVDPRRDHSLRVPRPDLTVSLGVPNACNGCHQSAEEDAEWAAAKVVEWFGERRGGDPHWAPAFAAGSAAAPEGETLLIDVARRGTTPAIVRASAIQLLQQYSSQSATATIDESLNSTDPLVRLTAVRSTRAQAPRGLLKKLAAALDDPMENIRIEAARRLVAVPTNLLDADQHEAMLAGLAAYRQRQAQYSDRSASHLNLASLAQQLGDSRTAIAELRTAIRLEPYWSGPRRELALLLESSGGDEDEIRLLREAEIERLERDARHLPNNSSIRYSLGLTHYQVGQLAEAEASLSEACQLEPENYEFRMALALLQEARFKQTGNRQHLEATAESLRQLHELNPNDPRAESILRRVLQVRRSLDAAKESRE